MNNPNLKWEETLSGYHQLIEYNPEVPNGNLVWAKVMEMRTSSSAEFLMKLPNDFKVERPSKVFSWGGPLTFLSSRWNKFKRERALKKAKKWLEGVYQEYFDILSTH